MWIDFLCCIHQWFLTSAHITYECCCMFTGVRWPILAAHHSQLAVDIFASMFPRHLGPEQESVYKRDEQISLINSFAFSFWANTFDFHTVLCSRMVVLYSPRQCQPTQSPLQRQTRSPTHQIFSFSQFPSVRFQHKTRYESISSDCIVYLYAVDLRDVNREQSISKQWPIKCAVALLASIGNCLWMWRE